MSGALDSDPMAAITEIRRLFGVGDTPAVQIKYAPPCATERSDLFNPDPQDVVRSICRTLGRGPDEWLAVAANTGMHDAAQTWVLDRPEADGGRRLAIVAGISFAWLNAALERQRNRGWMPGRNQEGPLKQEPTASAPIAHAGVPA